MIEAITGLQTLLVVRHGDHHDDHLTEEGQTRVANSAAYIKRTYGELPADVIMPCRKHQRTRETAASLATILQVAPPAISCDYDCDSHAAVGIIVATWTAPILVLVGHIETTQDLPAYLGGIYEKRMWGFETQPGGIVEVDLHQLVCRLVFP